MYPHPCRDCRKYLSTHAFSPAQLGRHPQTPRCPPCVAANERAKAVLARACASCSQVLHKSLYSPSQWRKGAGRSRCDDCLDVQCRACGDIGASLDRKLCGPCTEAVCFGCLSRDVRFFRDHMCTSCYQERHPVDRGRGGRSGRRPPPTRVCAQCTETLARPEFSSSQWSKGATARCMDCVSMSRLPLTPAQYRDRLRSGVSGNSSPAAVVQTGLLLVSAPPAAAATSTTTAAEPYYANARTRSFFDGHLPGTMPYVPTTLRTECPACGVSHSVVLRGGGWREGLQLTSSTLG